MLKLPLNKQAKKIWNKKGKAKGGKKSKRKNVEHPQKQDAVISTQ